MDSIDLYRVVCLVYVCTIATLSAEMFGGSDFWLETRVIIKISKKNDTSYKTQGFFIKKKKKKFEKKKFKMADSKNLVFQNHQFSIFFSENFMDWSLG